MPKVPTHGGRLYINRVTLTGYLALEPKWQITKHGAEMGKFRIGQRIDVTGSKLNYSIFLNICCYGILATWFKKQITEEKLAVGSMILIEGTLLDRRRPLRSGVVIGEHFVRAENIWIGGMDLKEFKRIHRERTETVPDSELEI